MSKRRQGKAKGGRAARHHEPQGAALPVPRPRRYSASGRDLLADGHQAISEFYAHQYRREQMEALGFIEEKLSPDEMMAALGINGIPKEGAGTDPRDEESGAPAAPAPLLEAAE